MVCQKLCQNNFQGVTRLGVAILYIAAAAPWIPLTEKTTGRKDLLRLPIYGCLSQKNTAHDSSVYRNVDVDPMSGKPQDSNRALLLTGHFCSQCSLFIC